MAKFIHWSPAEQLQIRQLARTHTMREAAAIIGRSYWGVRKYAERHRIPFYKDGEEHRYTLYSKQEIARVLQLAKEGYSSFEISRQTGISASYIRNLRKANDRVREVMEILTDGQST